MDVKLIGLRKIPLIKENDDIARIILDSMDLEGIEILDGDIFVIAETAVSKSEGTIIDLNSI
ncbi:MAG: coenzyme F420-0:L-glutamate ligase, partial [Methanobacterium paludis]|nr:coenzyme F420-0:L-glutamate ligase [Methanobacterium paludis]